MAGLKDQESTLGSQQVLRSDGTVFSLQQLLLPPGAARCFTPEQFLEAYLAYIRRFTCLLVRPRFSAAGLAFGLMGCVDLLIFAPPVLETSPGRSSLILRCVGGLLSRGGQLRHGQLRFDVEHSEAGSALTLELSDYHSRILGPYPPPFWRRELYRSTQSAVHQRLTLAFLRRLCRRLSGRSAARTIASLPLEEGGEI